MYLQCLILGIPVNRFRGMEHTSTVTRLFMRGSGVKTSGMAGDECTMITEKYMRESG